MKQRNDRATHLELEEMYDAMRRDAERLNLMPPPSRKNGAILGAYLWATVVTGAASIVVVLVKLYY